MLKGMSFASGLIVGALLACAACSQTPAYSTSPYGPVPGGPGYYGGPPPAGHPEISQAMSALQHARYVLEDKAASDYHGHKANAIGFIDSAINQLQICMSMP